MNACKCWLALVAMAAALPPGPTWAELSITGLEVTPRLDIRARGGSGVEETIDIMQAEINIRFSVNKDDAELVSFSLGPNLITAMTGRAKEMHFSNYYGIWNFGVDKPKLRFGQFVVPFGTLAEYDTHPLVLQTPYARTIGIRLDRGFSVESYRGDTDYWLSLTSGDGRGRVNGSYAANLRLARDSEVGDDIYRVGVSALYGPQMPVYHVTPAPLPHDTSTPPMRADKTRLAFDLDWLHGVDNIRAELVFGEDDGDFVNGQWVSWNHPFSYATDVTVAADRWRQSDGSAYGLGFALHHRLDDLSGVTIAYEPRWSNSDMAPDQSIGLFTTQYYRNFVLDF